MNRGPILSWMAGVILAALLLPDGRGPGAEEVLRPFGGRAVLGRPARIISMAPNLTEILFAIGAADQVAGVSRFSVWPPAAQGKPRIGGDINPDIEQILALGPDLILADTSANRRADVEVLDRLGLPVYVSRVRRFSDVPALMESVGRLVGRTAAGRQIADSMRARAARVVAAAAGRPASSVLLVTWGDPLIVVGGNTFMADLIRLAGGRNVAGDSPIEYPRLTLEHVLLRQPEYIIVASRHGTAPANAADRWRRWPALRAVREGHVASVDGDLVMRPGPRIVEGLERLAAILQGRSAADRRP